MRLFLIILLSSVSLVVSAQNSIAHDSCIYIEQMPEFPGGDMAMTKFIGDNIRYPTNEAEVTGRVIVGFVVNEDGSVSDIQVKKGLGKIYDDEAIRIVKLFPKFKPGKQLGKPVKVEFVLPVKFK